MLLKVLGEGPLVESGVGALIAVERRVENICRADFLDRSVCCAAGPKNGLHPIRLTELP